MKMFRSILAGILLCTTLTVSAKQQNDTIPTTQQDVSQWISNTSTNSNGKEVIHYYAIWKGILISTTKTTIEKVNLCNKYGARCALIVIGTKKNGRFQPKRITLD